jgi:hypothetical protein
MPPIFLSQFLKHPLKLSDQGDVEFQEHWTFFQGGSLCSLILGKDFVNIIIKVMEFTGEPPSLGMITPTQANLLGRSDLR